MKVMRILAKVFAIAGIVLNIGMFLYGLIALIAACVAAGSFAGTAYLIIAIVYLVISIVGIIVGTKIVSSLDCGEKSAALGVLGIFFLSLLGGIFYLIWCPTSKKWTPKDATDPYESIFGADYKERSFNPFDKVVILDDCSSIKPKISKGEAAYVIDSDNSNSPFQKRYTKVLFIRKDNTYEIYNFHNFVFNKVGILSDDYPYSQAEVGKTMKLNHDIKGLKAGDEVQIKQVIPNNDFRLLEKCIIQGLIKRANNKTKKVTRKVYSFYLNV